MSTGSKVTSLQSSKCPKKVQFTFFSFWGVASLKMVPCPIFLPDSNSLLSGLSNEVLFVSEFISQDDLKKEKGLVKA